MPALSTPISEPRSAPVWPPEIKIFGINLCMNNLVGEPLYMTKLYHKVPVYVNLAMVFDVLIYIIKMKIICVIMWYV